MEDRGTPAPTHAEHGTVHVLRRPRDRCWQLISLMSILALGAACTFLVLAQRHIKKEANTSVRDVHGRAYPLGSSLHPGRHETNRRKKPAAHLQGSNDVSGGSLKWLDNTPHTFTQGLLDLRNNTLVIPTSGKYFVYTQVVFNGGKCLSEKALYLSHKILLTSKSYPRGTTLMSAQKSMCTQGPPKPGNRQNAPWFRSIYQGAVFHFEREDHVFTQTDGVPHLKISHSMTFFGVFAL